MAFGEEPGQPDQDRRLARTHATDQQVRPTVIGVTYILHDHPAQFVSADDRTDIRRGGLDYVLWLVLRPLDDRRCHAAEPVEEEYRRGRGHRKERYEEPDIGAARRTVLAAATIEPGQDPRAGEHGDNGPHHDDDKGYRAEVGKDLEDRHPQSPAAPSFRRTGTPPGRLAHHARAPDTYDWPLEEGQQPPRPLVCKAGCATCNAHMAPLVFPLDWPRRRNPAKVVFLAVAIEGQRFQRMVCQ